MDSWTNEQLELMRCGGNANCRRYLEKHSTDIHYDFYSTPIPEKYNTPAAEEYKKQLLKRASKAGKSDETESSTETGEINNAGTSASTSLERSKNKKKQLFRNDKMDESVNSFAEDDSQDLAKRIRDTSSKEASGLSMTVKEPLTKGRKKTKRTTRNAVVWARP